MQYPQGPTRRRLAPHVLHREGAVADDGDVFPLRLWVAHGISPSKMVIIWLILMMVNAINVIWLLYGYNVVNDCY